MFTRLAALFAFAIALNCAAVPLPNPIVLVHGIQPSYAVVPDESDTWNDYYGNLTKSQGLAPGGAYVASFPGGVASGTNCVPIGTCDPLGDVFIVRFTSASDLTFFQQGGELAAILAEINRLRTIASKPTVKFTLVSHSMGGLATRFYLQNLHTRPSPYANDVARLITIGTPHKGSAFATACTIQGQAAFAAALLPLAPTGLTVPLVLEYRQFCDRNDGIKYLVPGSDSLNLIHRCTAKGGLDCGAPGTLYANVFSSSVRNAPHTLPATVNYEEFVVRVDRTKCGSYAYQELDSAHANSTPGLATCSSTFTYYSADGDDIVSDFSQRFLPPVDGNGVLSQTIANPIVQTFAPIVIRDDGLSGITIGHLQEAKSQSFSRY